MVILVIVLVASLIAAACIAKEVKRSTQKNFCPYCSFRKYCATGCNVEAKCSEEEQQPFICME